MRFVVPAAWRPALGLAGLLLGAGCQGVSPPDDSLGTVDSTAFDPLFGGGPGPTCLAPRSGIGGLTGIDAVPWIYLGPLTRAQLDIANSGDPSHPPPGAYVISGCTPIPGAFDPRTDVYPRTVQYPVLTDKEIEPNSEATYKPWHVVIPAAMRDRDPRPACNDIKLEHSLQQRAGWDPDTKVYGPGNIGASQVAEWPYGYAMAEGEWSSGLELRVVPPSAGQVRGGLVTFKDWPMVSVAMPVMRGEDPGLSCPLSTAGAPRCTADSDCRPGHRCLISPQSPAGGTATGTCEVRYPMFPGDPAADFHFPAYAWWRGLLSGYLDGGDVPVSADPARCPGGLPLCPVINDLYVPADEYSASNKLASPQVTLTDPLSGATRTADVLAVFGATPGVPGYSPVCRLHLFDKTKVHCGQTELDAQGNPVRVAPRPLCAASQIAATPGAVLSGPETYVHCLFQHTS